MPLDESSAAAIAEDDKNPGLPFPVVGVGASAGGLEAFTEPVSNLSKDAGLAILFVLHLEPHHKSYLAEVLARDSQMPIKEAVEGIPVEINTIYVIRPNTDMALVDGHLTISRRSLLRGQHTPIDHMFRSLAKIQKRAAVEVILSGGGSDGVLGFHPACRGEARFVTRAERAPSTPLLPPPPRLPGWSVGS